MNANGIVISWRYYRDATQAWDKGLELARSWTAAYPRESTAFNSLGFAAWSLGQYQQAIVPLRESIRLDPKFFAPTLNLVWTLTALNQFDEARKVLEDARAAKIDHIGFRQMAYVLAFIDNDTASMTRELDAALAKPEGPWASNWQAAHIGLWRPHRESARGVSSRASRRRARPTSPNCPGLYSAQDAISHAVVGQCAEARREAAAAIDLSRDNFTLESAGRALAWCGVDRRRSERVARAGAPLSGGDPDDARDRAGDRRGDRDQVEAAGACARTARAGETVRSCTGRRILAGVPARRGAAPARDAIPRPPTSSAASSIIEAS